MRLKDKVAVVVGAGQFPGAGIGNGRAAARTFAREGAKVFAVDRDEESLLETQRLVRDEGAECDILVADITVEDQCRAIADGCVERFERIDILHNNVGTGANDTHIVGFDPDAWDRIMAINVKGMAMTCKYVLPVMRTQTSGVIINVSSTAAVMSYPLIAYKVSKAGVNALTHTLAAGSAKYGVRVNAIMPGLMDTPFAMESHAAALNISLEELGERRDRQVPLKQRQGDAWDVANCALFLASDEAKFITGAIVPVDGGQTARVG